MSGNLLTRQPLRALADRVILLALSILTVIALATLFKVTFVSLVAIGLAIAIAAICPAASVVAIPAVIGFVFEPIIIGSLEFSPQEVLIWTTIAGVGLHACWALWQVRSPRIVRSFIVEVWQILQPFDLIALAFLVAGVISLATLALPAYRHESIRVFRWVILEPVLFYVLARWYLRGRYERRLAAVTFAAGALLVALIGLIDLASGKGLAVEGVTRLSGVYPHPNALALFLERPLVLTVGVATLYRARLRWKWLLAAGVVGLTLVLTFSRGAVLASGVVIVVMLLVGQRRRLAAFAALAGVALGAALALTASARLENLFSGGSGSLRLALWSSAVDMIRDHPITGIGLDQFLYVYAPRYVKPEAWSERFTSHPHNIILDTWLSLGIMGVVIALAYLGIFAWMTVRVARKRSPLGVAAAAAVCVGLLHGLVDNGYFLPDLALIFWFLTALIAVESFDKVEFDQQDS